MAKKSKKGSKDKEDKPKGKGGKKGKKDKAPPEPKGKSSAKKGKDEPPPEAPPEAPPPEAMLPPPPPPPPPPASEPPGSAEQKKQTEALKSLMERKLDVWNKILVSPKDEERKEGLKNYKSMAEEELRIIARNISKTKLQELIDQKVNYFVQIGVSDAEDQKLAGLQGFKQISEEERLLAALEAPDLARRVFADVKMGEVPSMSLKGPPTALSPGSLSPESPGALSPSGTFSPPGRGPGAQQYGMQAAFMRGMQGPPGMQGMQGPPGMQGSPGAFPRDAIQRPSGSVTTLTRDMTVLNKMADELNRASMMAKAGQPQGGVRFPGMQPQASFPRPGQQPPPLPLPPQGLRQQLALDQSQLMEDAWDMQRRLPKRRLPPAGTPEVHNKSRLVSEFVEKLAAEIASKRISKNEARNQLKDVVELENELAETLVSATSVKPDMTEEKLAAIAQMYQDISQTVIANPDMNRDEALNKLKTVAAMEHELTQALVSDEEIANRPFRTTTAEQSAFKLQQLKLNLADELQQNMAVSQPDADKIQQSIKRLYELEVMLMEKLFNNKSGKGRDRDREREREFDRAGIDEPKRVYLKKSKKPATVVEISFSDTDDNETGVTPVIRVVDSSPALRGGGEQKGHSCPVHGNHGKPCPAHSRKDKEDKVDRGDRSKACPVHSDPRGKPKITWSMHPLAPESVDLSEQDMQLLTGRDSPRRGRLGSKDEGRTFADKFRDFRPRAQDRDFSVLAKIRQPPPFRPPQPQAPGAFPPPPPPAFPPAPPPPFHPYPGSYMDPHSMGAAMYPQYPPFMHPAHPPHQAMPPYMYPPPPQEDTEVDANLDQPPAEPRIIVPTRYKNEIPEELDNIPGEEAMTVLGDNAFYSKETWETKPCMPPNYMNQYQAFPVMDAPDREYALPRYRPQPNVDVGVDASSMYPAAVTDTEFDLENDRILGLETGIQITIPAKQANVATAMIPAPVPAAVEAQQAVATVTVPVVAAPAVAPQQVQAITTTISATETPPAPPPPRRRRSRRPRRSSSRERFRRRRRFSDLDEDDDDSDFVRPRRRTRSRMRSRSRTRSRPPPRGRRYRDDFNEDSDRPVSRRRRQRSRVTRRNRPSRTEATAEEVPGIPFWDWICKSICNLLPFSRDGKGNKVKRGANIQRLVDDVMVTSQEVVQAKRKLQSNNGSAEASVRSMGDLESKLWKLIDLEVDLVNELARYRWSGDVQDPKAEMKLNSAEEKIWRVIGVQTRLAQDLGDWRKTSTRSFHNSGMDAPQWRMPYGGGPGQYGNFGPQGNYGPPDNMNRPGSFGNPSMYPGPSSRGSVGNQEGFADPDMQMTDKGDTEEASESPSPSPSPQTKPKRKASKKSKRSGRSSRLKKKGKRQSPGLPSRRSSKNRSKSRGPSSSTSNTNTSNYTTEPTSSENTSSSNASTSAGSDQDSVTITNTIIISSELEEEGDPAAKPSAVSWKSPSKEFLSSIDRSHATPVEWETKKKGKYIYVRAKPAGGAQARETKRSASYGGQRSRRWSAGPRDSLERYERGGGRDYADDSRGGRNRAKGRKSRSRRGSRSPERYAERGTGYDIRVHRGRRRPDDDPLLSLSLRTSDGTDNTYNRWGPRGGYGGEERGGAPRRRRRSFRSVGPERSRTSYQSRSQWSL